MRGSEQGDWHVVFDCNVMLNVCRGFRPVAQWDGVLARLADAPQATGSEDLRALAFSANGKLDTVSVRVWSNDHIVDTTIHQARKPVDTGGLGLSFNDAGLVALGGSHEVRDNVRIVTPAVFNSLARQLVTRQARRRMGMT